MRVILLCGSFAGQNGSWKLAQNRIQSYFWGSTSAEPQSGGPKLVQGNSYLICFYSFRAPPVSFWALQNHKVILMLQKNCILKELILGCRRAPLVATLQAHGHQGQSLVSVSHDAPVMSSA